MARFPEFSAAEMEEARRFNRWLRYAPRFRAPGALRKFLIQSSLFAQQAVSPRLPGVSISTRRVSWKGQTFDIRILTPEGPVRGVYIDYHGGGWSIGTAAMDDRVNARIARDSRLAVVSVDYTLIPLTTLEPMIVQCAAAADWVFEHSSKEFGSEAMFIGGESAGAHLAACSMLRLRETRRDFDRLRGVVLFYGPFDLSCTPSVRAATAETLVLHGPSIFHGIGKLTEERGEDQRRDPAISPAYADLHGLPPGLLLCGTIDPLIDDSRLMATRWQAQSGNAELVVIEDAPHAFNRLPTAVAERTNAYVRSWIDARLVAASDLRAAAE
ncbi:MAG: alpha/beta hydrolase fold domain-containing protein [Hyphomonadaceae bacterium]|nr:alpha/beta hydrolase fold domain-containing protein [Hyphomonadaceae bacterium]